MRLYIYVSIISVPRETRPLRRAAQSIYRTYEENNQVRSLNISLFFFQFPALRITIFIATLVFRERYLLCPAHIFTKPSARLFRCARKDPRDNHTLHGSRRREERYTDSETWMLDTFHLARIVHRATTLNRGNARVSRSEDIRVRQSFYCT